MSQLRPTSTTFVCVCVSMLSGKKNGYYLLLQSSYEIVVYFNILIPIRKVYTQIQSTYGRGRSIINSQTIPFRIKFDQVDLLQMMKIVKFRRRHERHVVSAVTYGEHRDGDVLPERRREDA